MTDPNQSPESTPNAVSSPLQNETLLTYYLGILQRRIWIIVSLLIIGGTLGLIRGVRQPRIYRATSRVLVEQQMSRVMRFEQGGPEGARWDESYYETQTQLVRSRAVLDIALQDPNIRSVVELDPDFGRASLLSELRRSLLAILGASPAPMEEPWERLQERVHAEYVPNTHFVDIAVISRRKKNAVLLANRVAEAYEVYHREVREESLGDAFVKLESEKKEEELALLQAEQKLQAFREQAEGVTVTMSSGEPQPAVERLNSLNRKLTEVQLQRIELESQLGVMDKAMAAGTLDDEAVNRALFALPVISDDSALTEAQQNLAQAQEERAMLAQTYGPSHPLYKAAESKTALLLEQFRTALRDVVESERNRFEMLGQEEEELRRQYDAQRASALELAKEDFQLTRLQNAVDRHRRLYDALVERMREVDVTSSLIQTNVRIVERASPPDAPVSPGVRRTVAIALVISLLLGVGLAFVFENLDDTVKTPEDLKERFKVPLLGFVPAILSEGESKERAQTHASISLPRELAANVKQMVRDRVMVWRPAWFMKPEAAPTEQQNADRLRRGMMVVNESASSVAEAYRGIRTSLFYSVPANTVRTLAVTSCRPQEGKTTTCANLALSIAQTGKRVLLIDGDMHRPMLHRTLGIERGTGLTSILVGERAWKDVVKRVEVNKETAQHLDAITAGPTSPNPSELLGSSAMHDFVDAIRDAYDWVIIDTPPVLFVSDASVMGVLCDGVIVVVKSGMCTRTLLQRAREQLDSVSSNIIGTILNSVQVSRVGRHSSSYYNYGYSRYAKDYKSLYYARSDGEEDEERVASTAPAPSVPAPSASASGSESPSEPPPEAVSEAVSASVPEQAEPIAVTADGRDDEAADKAVNGKGVSEPRRAPPPSRFDRQIRKARQLASAGQLERADEMLASLQRLAPEDLSIREAEVSLKLDTGRSDEAERRARELLAADAGNAYALHILATMDIVRGDYKDAQIRLTESIARQPYPESLNNMAWLLNAMGAYAEAESYARQAVAMDPSIHHAWDTLGKVQIRQDRIEEARHAFTKALKLAGDDICAALNMAEIDVREGNLRAAGKRLRRLKSRRSEMIASERKRFHALEVAAMES